MGRKRVAGGERTREPPEPCSFHPEPQRGDVGGPGARKRGERTALVVVGHFKFELPRAAFDRCLAGVETKVGNDPDRLVAEIKRRLKFQG